jgi:hypothetical protein
MIKLQIKLDLLTYTWLGQVKVLIKLENYLGFLHRFSKLKSKTVKGKFLQFSNHPMIFGQGRIDWTIQLWTWIWSPAPPIGVEQDWKIEILSFHELEDASYDPVTCHLPSAILQSRSRIEKKTDVSHDFIPTSKCAITMQRLVPSFAAKHHSHTVSRNTRRCTYHVHRFYGRSTISQIVLNWPVPWMPHDEGLTMLTSRHDSRTFTHLHVSW